MGAGWAGRYLSIESGNTITGRYASAKGVERVFEYDIDLVC